jgi:hypothetical protein
MTMARLKEIRVRGMVMVRPAVRMRGRASHSTLTVRLVRSASNMFFFLIDKKRRNIFRIHLERWLRSRAYPTIPTKIL